jgi:uncharacterized protein YdhG (YjbR/CyaY superfamily)
MAVASTVEEYIGGFPPEVRVLLLRLRETIRQVAPASIETMAAGHPTVMVDGAPKIQWVAAKKHVTLLGVGDLPGALGRELADFRVDDGLQFAYRKDVPFEEIADVVAELAKR